MLCEAQDPSAPSATLSRCSVLPGRLLGTGRPCCKTPVQPCAFPPRDPARGPGRRPQWKSGAVRGSSGGVPPAATSEPQGPSALGKARASTCPGCPWPVLQGHAATPRSLPWPGGARGNFSGLERGRRALIDAALPQRDSLFPRGQEQPLSSARFLGARPLSSGVAALRRLF